MSPELILMGYTSKATDVFAAFHALSSWRSMKDLQIGSCPEAGAEALQDDFRALRAKMQQDRMFESSKAFYVFKVRRAMR